MRRLISVLLIGVLWSVFTLAPARAQPVYEATPAETTAGTAGAPKYISPRRMKTYVDAAVAAASAVPLVWRGTWSAGTDYAANDAVAYNGSSYYASGNPTTGDVPGVDGDWSLLASKGDTGATGPTGDTGPAGADGADGANGTDGADGAGYGGTSTSSVAIGSGEKTFTTQAGLAYLANASRVRVASAADPSDYVEGVVSSYSSTTLVIDVDAYSGSGTVSDWVISLAGEPAGSGIVVDHGNAGTTETIDLSAGRMHIVTLDQASCEVTLIGAPASGLLGAATVRYIQDAGGGGAVTYATGSDPVDTDPTIDTTGSAFTDVLYTTTDGGTNWYASGGVLTAAVADGDKGDVVVSGGVWAIDTDIIVDADINGSAAIAWSKISKSGAAASDVGAESSSSDNIDPDRIAGDTTNDDKLQATLVDVDNTATSYTAASANVEAHLTGINTALGTRARTDAGNTLTGTQLLNEGASIGLDAAGSADGAYSGITLTGTAGATLAFGDLIVLDVTDSRWELADANSAAAADGDARGLIGICVQAAAGDGSATTVLLSGIVRADTAFPTLTVTAPVFISETAGDITSTSPTTEDAVVRVLGWATTADEIFFNPAGLWVIYDAP